MRIGFSPLSLDVEEWFPAYDVIAILIEQNRHGIDPLSIRAIGASRWAASRPKSLMDLFRRSALARSNVRDVDRSSVLIDSAAPEGGQIDMALSSAVLTPLEAIAYLSGPFHVIVENEVFDGSFLLWMAKAIGYDRLVSAYREGRFIFRHAGGKGAFARCAEVLTTGVLPGTPRHRGQAMRLWAAAFLDSDSKHPANAPNSDIVAQTERHVTFVRQLQRRSIENYIPGHYLTAHNSSPERKRMISALERLTDVQRTHFHMKVGFKHDKVGSRTKASYNASTNISPHEKALFSTVSESDFWTLALGFGDGLSDIFRNPRLRPSGNDKHLTDQSDRAELLELCRRIFERL